MGKISKLIDLFKYYLFIVQRQRSDNYRIFFQDEAMGESIDNNSINHAKDLLEEGFQILK